MSDTPILDKEKTEVPGKTATPKGTKQVQIHAGNVPVVTCQLLSELNVNIARIARCIEIVVKETYPNAVKPKVEPVKPPVEPTKTEKPKVEEGPAPEKPKEPTDG